MKKKKLEAPTLDNIQKLFSKRLNDFKGESRRSYQKAFSSFQIFLITHYPPSAILDKSMIKNWIIHILSRGLTHKTVTFYLEKIASLYSSIGCNLEGGISPVFKEVKHELKSLNPDVHYACVINTLVETINEDDKKALLESMQSDKAHNALKKDNALKCKWIALALKAGLRADQIMSVMNEPPESLEHLTLASQKELTDEERQEVFKTVENYIYGEPMQWFAMRLRPKAKFDQILERFSHLSTSVKIPEIFYPSEEIAKRVGRKVMWKDKPVIHDIVFFRKRKSEIYSLFTNLYDLAWCYRTPGGGAGQYASIPDKAMEEFRKSIDFLSPDFEVAPAGKFDFRAGDEVIVVSGKYMEEHGHILKKAKTDESGNKIYRVSLLHGNGHWDIGIDARLLKKT